MACRNDSIVTSSPISSIEPARRRLAARSAEASELAAAAELLRQVGGRQQPALGKLFDLYADWVFSVALRVLGDHHDAEEAVGDVFIQVWERASTYCPERGSVRAWLLAIAYSRALDIKGRVRPRRGVSQVIPISARPEQCA